MSTQRQLTLTTLGLAFATLWIAGCTPERTSQKRLDTLVGAYGYSLYTPFRSGDYPATVFVYARNHQGKTTEFTLSPWMQTFAAEDGSLFPPEGEDVGFANRIEQTVSLNGALAAELLKPVVTFSSSFDYAKEVKIEFGGNQRKHVMPLATLEKYRNKLQDETRASLKRFKESGNLDQVFMVLETLSVDKISITVVGKRGASGKVSVDEIKPVGNVKLEVGGDSGNRFELSFEKPLIIGYKAMRFSDTLLSDVVSPPPIQAVLLTPEEVSLLKK